MKKNGTIKGGKDKFRKRKGERAENTVNACERQCKEGAKEKSLKDKN